MVREVNGRTNRLTAAEMPNPEKKL